MKNNKGFSLVELIVVVAILGVCVGIVSMSLSTIFSSRAKKCANEISSLLSQCKVSAMSRSGSVYLKIFGFDGEIRGQIYENTADGEKCLTDDSLGGPNVTVSFTAGGNAYNVSNTALYISFNRETGAFIDVNEAEALAGVSSGVSGSCDIINVSGGSRNYEIALVPSTGYHSIGG